MSHQANQPSMPHWAPLPPNNPRPPKQLLQKWLISSTTPPRIQVQLFGAEQATRSSNNAVTHSACLRLKLEVDVPDSSAAATSTPMQPTKARMAPSSGDIHHHENCDAWPQQQLQSRAWISPRRTTQRPGSHPNHPKKMGHPQTATPTQADKSTTDEFANN